MALMVPPRGVTPGDSLIVVHDFEARGTDELTLRRGEKLELIELDDGFGDGWYLGRHLKTGTTGLFPGVYTAASKSTPAPNTFELDSQEAHTIAAANGQPTPQASRHLSASGPGTTAPITITTSDDSPPASPKQSMRVSSSPLPASSSTSRHSLGGHLNGQDSPVMNETLSVIDEHITDLSTPRHSLAPPDLRASSTSAAAVAANSPNSNNHHNNDSGSEYSAPFGRRFSYINGQETDEEEESRPTEDQVRKWGQQETARHLRDLGVDDKHCDIFEEQEITGDVLLDMDQDFLFMKEFDFGVMGRRLKTWHKVKAFQEDVKGATAMSSSSSSPYPGGAPEELSRSASRAAGHTGTFLPRIPTFTEKSAGSGGYVGQSRASTSSANQQHHSRLSSIQSTNSSYGIDRPSAASVRGINHSRRHSSIDTTNRSFDLGSDSSAHPSAMFGNHQSNKPSLDRSWSMAGAGRRPPTRPGTAMGTSTTILGGAEAQRATMQPQQPPAMDLNECDSAISVTDRYDDLDRGYFSGPEGDKKNNSRRVLTKRSSDKGSSMTHSRQSSYNDDPRRHSRIASIDSIRDAARATKPSPSLGKGRLRSLSTRLGSSDGSSKQQQLQQQAEAKSATTPGSGTSSNTSPMGTGLFSFTKSSGDGSARSSTIPFKNAGPKIRRAVGLDSTSSSPSTSSPTANNISTNKSDSPTRDGEPAALARTGSATPSAASKTSSRHSGDRQSTGSGKAVDLAFPRTRPSLRSSNVKSKQETSAYIQGLEKKAPKEQMELCDYSGWMKKRSSNLMTTWKPRLFVLRGRRLSYYYSETDQEERGLIDITGHRVLRADNDPIVTLHATITGSTTSPTSPANANGISPSTEKNSSESIRNLKGENSGPFFFKLVPPKAGYARSVQFTKPAIHYFQVDTIREGRLWMAALMKATIERDMEQPVESTNKQKTISLKQARMTNQRPPALSTPDPQEEDEDVAEANAEAEADANDESRDSSGLGLGELGLDKPTPESSDPEGKEKPNIKPLGSNPLGGIDTGPSLLQESVSIARET